MLKYLVALFMLLAGYYSFSYGVFQWKNEKNKLGAFGTILFSVIGTVLPIVYYFIQG